MRLFVVVITGLLFFSSAVFAQADMIIIPVQAIIASDDNGDRMAHTSVEDIQAQIDFANKVYAAANIQFTFTQDKTNPINAKSTLLNNMMGIDDPYWPHAKATGNNVARKYPGKMVVFFRFGPDKRPTGFGFSWTDYDFIVMPAYKAGSHCGHPHVDALAHEIGHYLGLSHTFVGDPFNSKEEAERYFKKNNSQASAFDGDRYADTLPDPAIRDLECRRVSSIVLENKIFSLPRRNIMSYYDERDSLSPQQIARVRSIAAKRFR